MQTRNRLVRWRIVFLGLILAGSIVVGATAVDQNRQFMAGWAASRSGDHATAFRLWRPLAEHGHIKAQHNIGSMYLQGQGVPKDYTEGEIWTRKAAEQGRAIAQYNLGWMYVNGRGVPRDNAEAAKWYRMAAEQKEPNSLNALGIMYARGSGVPQDIKVAYMWFIIAVAHKSERAVEFRNESAKKLTPAQLTEAQQMAREWMEEHGQTNSAQRRIATAIKAAAVAVDTILSPVLALIPTLKSAPAIVGVWQSTPALGQLGLFQSTMMFNEDGSVTRKFDFVSFPGVQPELEYLWIVSNGTYSMDGDEVTVNFDKTWNVLKLRGIDEIINLLKQRKKRPQVWHWEEGKLVAEDLELKRLKNVDPGEQAAWKRIAGYPERTDFERRKEVDPGELAAWKRIANSSERADLKKFLKDYPDGRFADQAKDRFVALVLSPSSVPADTPVQPAVGVYPKTDQEIGFTLTQTFLNPTPALDDLFGFSVAISSDQVLIGARWDNAGAKESGAVYLFDAATGNLLHTFLNPTPAAKDNFGFSVAISGDKVLVGAWGDGGAYLFDAVTGDLVHTLNPTSAAKDHFVGSVAISGDKVLVGAWGGAVYLFDAATGNLLHTFLNPTPAAKDNFGFSVAISGDKVLIGALLDGAGAKDGGAAYLFDAATGNLLHTLLKSTPAAKDYFGRSVAISGDKVLVGAWGDDAGAKDSGAVYLFDAATGNLLHTFLNPTPDSGDHFGSSVTISGDKVLIGARADDAGAKDSGAAYLFSLVPTNPK